MKWVLRCDHCKRPIIFPTGKRCVIEPINAFVTAMYHPHCYVEKNMMRKVAICIDGEYKLVKEEFKPIGIEV